MKTKKTRIKPEHQIVRRGVGPDERPAQCRFRLRDEGKPYPRSQCTACGRTIKTGLGNQCQAFAPKGVLPVALAPVNLREAPTVKHPREAPTVKHPREGD